MQKLLLKLILLFCVSSNIRCLKYYGQYLQDKYVHNTFFKDKKNGVFVEIGASDGITFSNTYFFEKNMGWNGLCIEPAPHLYKQLISNGKCNCINGCLANFTGKSKFLAIEGYGQGLSGLIEFYDPRHLKRIEKIIKQHNSKKKIIEVHCYNPQDIFTKNNISKIDYMTIDTEGSELEILKAINFNLIYIDIIQVENNYKTPEIKNFLQSKGYKFVIKIGVDEIYKKI